MILSDINVRKALAYAVPREEIVKDIFLGHAEVADTPINPNSWLKNTTKNVYVCNTDLAKSLLTQNGWADTDNDGILEKNGEKLSFVMLINSENEHRLAAAESIKESFKKIGVELKLDVQSYEAYTHKLYEKDFEMVYAGWKLSTVPDLTFAFHSSQIESGSNFISYRSSEMDNLLQQAFSSTQESSTAEAFLKIQNLITEDLPYISLYFRNTAVLADGKIHGEISSNVDNLYIGIENWYIHE